MPCVASQVVLTREEFNRATTIFDELDRNHDGLVDLISFQAVMEAVGRRNGKYYTFEGIQSVFIEADLNEDGVIDYDEWMAMQIRDKRRRLGLPDAEPYDTDEEASVALADVEGSRLRRSGAEGLMAATEYVSSVGALHELLANLAQSADDMVAHQAADLLQRVGQSPRRSAPAERQRSGPQHSQCVGGEGNDAEDAPHFTRQAIAAVAVGARAEGPRRVAPREVRPADGRAEDSEDDEEDGCGQGQGHRATQEAGNAEGTRRGTQVLGRMDEGTLAGTVGSSSTSLTVLSGAMSSSTVEVGFNQIQSTGLASVVLTDWVERLSLEGARLPSLAVQWRRYLAWTEVFNFDLSALDRLVALLADGERLDDARERLATTLEAVPFSTTYIVLTAFVPLAISFVILVIYKPLLRVLWFL